MATEDFFQTLLSQIAATPMLEVVAVFAAIGYVLLAARQNILCWFCALLSTVCYVIVFWQVSLPFQTGLNGYYVLMAVYGFWQWRQGDNHLKAVTSLSMREHALGISLVLGVTIALALLWQEIAFTPFVYVDVFVTVASVVTTLLVAHKKLENWIYWMVINLVAAWLYWQVDLFLTSALFILYCGLAMYGFWQWRKDYRLHHQDNQRSMQNALR